MLHRVETKGHHDLNQTVKTQWVVSGVQCPKRGPKPNTCSNSPCSLSVSKTERVNPSPNISTTNCVFCLLRASEQLMTPKTTRRPKPKPPHRPQIEVRIQAAPGLQHGDHVQQLLDGRPCAREPERVKPAEDTRSPRRRGNSRGTEQKAGGHSAPALLEDVCVVRKVVGQVSVKRLRFVLFVEDACVC